jgi:hypothetical protein
VHPELRKTEWTYDPTCSLRNIGKNRCPAWQYLKGLEKRTLGRIE